jgi:hypothetical protein
MEASGLEDKESGIEPLSPRGMVNDWAAASGEE